MKLDSESTYHHTYPNDHIPKVIVHNGNHFILPKDNHFMVDRLDIDETSKEGIYGVESPNEYDSCKVILPPKQHGIPNMEHFITRNNNEYDILKSSYSGSNPEIGLVVKEDYYANKAVAKVEASEVMVVCVSDGSCQCHRVENISEVVHSFQNSFVEKQEVGHEASFSSNKSSNNDNCNVEKEMEEAISSPDLKYEVVGGDPITIARYPAEATSMVMNSAESCSCVSTIESGDDLDTSELVKCIASEGGDKLDTVELVKCNVLEGGCKPDTNDSIASDSSDKVIETELPASEKIEENLLQVNSPNLGLQVDSSSLDCSDDKRQSIGILDEVTEKCLLLSEELNNDSLQEDSSNLGCSDDQKKSMDGLDEVDEKELPPSEELNNDSLQVDLSSLGCSSDQKQSMDILDEVIEKQLPPSEELNRDLLQVDSSSLGCSVDQKQPIDRSQNDQAIFEEKTSTTTNVSSGAKDSVLSGEDKEVLSSCKVPTEVITFIFDPQVTSISGKDKNRENRDSQQPKQAHIGPGTGTETASPDGATTSTQRSLHNLAHGDSNLTGPAFLSGSTANSGHIHYSGSISIRSDSSTTSARSFAFPILHSEWNSSPVKMAKATRRRGWRTGLLCCRF